MSQIIAYLSFSGECREAMTFYQQCLGGELSMDTIGDSPIAADMPPEAAQNILHSSLTSGGMTIYASDMGCMGSPDGVVRGNGMSLLILCSSEAEINDYFAKLLAGGQVVMPLAEQFWGDTFGNIVDKFGITWLLNLPKATA